jgi:hypothetical protein
MLMEKRTMYVVKYSDGVVTKIYGFPFDLCNTVERLLRCHNEYYKKQCKIMSITNKDEGSETTNGWMRLVRI